MYKRQALAGSGLVAASSPVRVDGDLSADQRPGSVPAAAPSPSVPGPSAASSPAGEPPEAEDVELSPIEGWVDPDPTFFRFLPGVRNIPEHFRRGPSAINVLPQMSALYTEPPPEPNPRTSAKWKLRPPLALKYVDDGVSVDKINFETAVRTGNSRLKQACLLYTSPSPRD